MKRFFKKLHPNSSNKRLYRGGFLGVVFFWLIWLVFITNSQVFACTYSGGGCTGNTFSCVCPRDDAGNVRYCAEASGGTTGCLGYGTSIYSVDFWSGSDCTCGGGGGLPDPRVGGAVTVEGITPAGPPPPSCSDSSRWSYVRPADGITGYAGPDGHVQVFGGGITDPLKAYCDANVQWCCDPNGNFCRDSSANGCGDYMEGSCSGEDFVSHGITGTSNLTITADSTKNPRWTSKIRYGGKSSGSDLQCSSLANDTGTCGSGACTSLSRGPFFNFDSFTPGSHTFTINTSTTDGYVPVSMTLNGIPSVTCDGSPTCSITANLNAGDNQNLAIVIRKAAPPPCPTNFSVTCAGSGAQATIDWDDLPGVASYIIRLNKAPTYDWLNAAGGDQWLTSTLSTITPNIIHDSDYTYDVQGKTAGGVVGARCPFNVFKCPAVPPTCQIFGSSEVTYGTSWMGTTTASIPGSPTSPVSVESAYSTSSTFPPAVLGTRLGTLNGTGTTPALNINWTPLETDIGKTYYFYCRGNNGLDWNNPYRQCRPFAYGAYPSDVDCFNGVKDSTCKGTGTDCIPVEVKEPRGWFQVKGGDVHSQTSITSPLPVSATQPYFNLDLDTYPGLISYVNSHNFSAIFNDPNEINRSSSKKWLAQSPFSPAKSTFNYFYQKMGSPTADNFSCTDSGSPCPNPPVGTKIYYSADSVTISGNDSWSIPNNSKVIVLVNGDLTISLNTNKRITVAKGGFLAFIVKGDIKIEGQVGNKQMGPVDAFNDAFIQGIYISSNASDTTGGTIETVDGIEGVGLGPGFRFTGSGLFYAQRNITLRRNLKKDNATDPAELFLFRPDLVINAPYELWSSKIDWQEVAP